MAGTLPRPAPTSLPPSRGDRQRARLPSRAPSLQRARGICARDTTVSMQYASFLHSSLAFPLTKTTVLHRSPQVVFSSKNGAHVVEARCIDDIYDMLAEHLCQVVDKARFSGCKYIIGLAGPPGAGKSTVASEVICRLNIQWKKKMQMDSVESYDDIGIVVPMDGFHLYRSQLDKMENPEEAHARRGASWTFDPARLLHCLKTLRKQGAVAMPSFDHGVGDPVENDVIVSHNHKVVIVEGNYLLLDDDIWKDISCIFDEKWFIEVDIDTAMERVLGRHISTGRAPDVAKWRIEYNDRPNAEIIMKSKANADILIRSVDANISA